MRYVGGEPRLWRRTLLGADVWCILYRRMCRLLVLLLEITLVSLVIDRATGRLDMRKFLLDIRGHSRTHKS